MKVTSRHSFTLFRPFLWKKPFFLGENGTSKMSQNASPHAPGHDIQLGRRNSAVPAKLGYLPNFAKKRKYLRTPQSTWQKLFITVEKLWKNQTIWSQWSFINNFLYIICTFFPFAETEFYVWLSASLWKILYQTEKQLYQNVSDCESNIDIGDSGVKRLYHQVVHYSKWYHFEMYRQVVQSDAPSFTASPISGNIRWWEGVRTSIISRPGCTCIVGPLYWTRVNRMARVMRMVRVTRAVMVTRVVMVTSTRV